MRCAIARACLCTCLKHYRCSKKSTVCLISKTSRRAADSTSKITACFIYFIGSVVKIVYLVNYIWCKVLAKFKTQTESSSNVEGSTKTSALAFINGTNSVTKHQV